MARNKLEATAFHPLEPLNIPSSHCRGNGHGPRPAPSEWFVEINLGAIIVMVHLCNNCKLKLSKAP